ncbi:MAG TPA: hypothetical protein VE821_16300, partial [Pyrinomonadaceae bacterium]|nr:hypothetical protein [Pyrinomonadaceae bacterium]
ENQIHSLKQELARFKGKKRVRRNARRAAESSTQSGGGTPLTAEVAPRLSASQAVAIASNLLDKRPQPPDYYIISVLEGRGLTPEQARHILKEARDRPMPPTDMEKELG